MLEIIYHGGESIELSGKHESLICDDSTTQYLKLEDHYVLYLHDLNYDGERKEFDVIFVLIKTETSLEEILGYLRVFTSKYVIPMYLDTSITMMQMLQDFARRVMLNNYGVPKVLKSGQMVVL